MTPIIHLDRSGGGSGIGWQGQVEFRADLPITLGTPAIGDVYLVEKPTTILLGAYTTYQSGLYIRDFNNGNLNDWRRLNVKVKFTDSEFAVVSAVDQSKQAKLDISLVAASTTRTLQVPDKDGVIALISDIGSSNTLEDVLTNGNVTGTNDISFDNNQRGIATNGDSFFDLRFGQNYNFIGADVNGGAIVGFAYIIEGDVTFSLGIGVEIRVRDTQSGNNDGIHTLTDVHFDGSNTRIQWAIIVTELSAPYGSAIKPQDNTSAFGLEDTHFSVQEPITGFKIASIINRFTDVSFAEFYSLFGFVYNWVYEQDDVNPNNHRRGGVTIHNNTASNGATTLGDFDVLPVSASVNRATFDVLTKNVGAGGAEFLRAKTDKTWYSRKFGINHEGVGVDGHDFETIIDSVKPTADRTQTLQDEDGVIALVKDIKASKGNFIKDILDVATLTANVNDWSPTGFNDNTDLIRVDVDVNNREITGIIAPSIGVNRILGINNINNASLDIRFMHNDGSSLAENRFLLRDNGNRAIKPNETAWFWYDHSVNRWKPFNRVG